MLIIGAKGFAKELFEVCSQLRYTENTSFYDDVSNDLPKSIFDKFPILRNEDEAKLYFQNQDRRFILGLGNPLLRKQMVDKFTKLGGRLTSIISPKANIAKHQVIIERGATILDGAHITSSVKIGSALLMYPNSVVTHDCVLGDFVDISPGATLLGRCILGSFVSVGSNTSILPNVKIGSYVQIGAGSVVTKDIPDNSLVVGAPARVIKKIDKFKY